MEGPVPVDERGACADEFVAYESGQRWLLGARAACDAHREPRDRLRVLRGAVLAALRAAAEGSAHVALEALSVAARLHEHHAQLAAAAVRKPPGPHGGKRPRGDSVPSRILTRRHRTSIRKILRRCDDAQFAGREHLIRSLAVRLADVPGGGWIFDSVDPFALRHHVEKRMWLQAAMRSLNACGAPRDTPGFTGFCRRLSDAAMRDALSTSPPRKHARCTRSRSGRDSRTTRIVCRSVSRTGRPSCLVRIARGVYRLKRVRCLKQVRVVAVPDLSVFSLRSLRSAAGGNRGRFSNGGLQGMVLNFVRPRHACSLGPGEERAVLQACFAAVAYSAVRLQAGRFSGLAFATRCPHRDLRWLANATRGLDDAFLLLLKTASRGCPSEGVGNLYVTRLLDRVNVLEALLAVLGVTPLTHLFLDMLSSSDSGDSILLFVLSILKLPTAELRGHHALIHSFFAEFLVSLKPIAGSFPFNPDPLIRRLALWTRTQPSTG
ncbi:hypothetical protein DIPPA_03296 [Diplonema papillatum]|nr:hypothetical protein DIPPA_03296 [Diplonema papillatum]